MNRVARYFQISLFLIFMACSRQDAVVERHQEILQVTVVDSIGINSGEPSYMFGEIQTIRENDSGDIFVLDRVKRQVSVFDSQGDYLRTISREGSAPGEFLNPVGFDLDTSGNLLVLDFMHGKVFRFTPDGEYISTVLEYQNMAPSGITVYSDSAAIILFSEELVSDGGGLILDTFLATVQFGAQEHTNLWQTTGIIDLQAMESLFYSSILSVVYDVDSEGNLYYAPARADVFEFISCDLAGTNRFTVTNPVEPREKTELQLNEEAVYVSNLAAVYGGGIPNEIHPPRNCNAIIDIDVDHRDRVWIRSGLTAKPTFQVYSDSGEYLATVEVIVPLEDENIRWEFEIHKTICAYPANPDEFYRVYMFEAVDDIL